LRPIDQKGERKGDFNDMAWQKGIMNVQRGEKEMRPRLVRI